MIKKKFFKRSIYDLKLRYIFACVYMHTWREKYSRRDLGEWR